MAPKWMNNRSQSRTQEYGQSNQGRHLKRTKLFVGRLPDGCSSTDLSNLFEKYGSVKECDVINKYGFVHMSNQDEAEEAIKHLNNYNFMGSNISVEQSTSKLHPEPGAPGRAKGGPGGPMRRGGMRNGFARDGYYGDAYFGPFGPPRDPFYDGPTRSRPYPLPYERRGPPMPGQADPYGRRPLPPPPGPRDDLYARRPMPFDEPYERRPMQERPDYLYTRRSPPTSHRSYWYSSVDRNGRTPLFPPLSPHEGYSENYAATGGLSYRKPKITHRL